MFNFIQSLQARNETLYIFGLVCFVFAVVFIALSKLTPTQVFNVSAWYKPFKFAMSIGIYSWTMAWYCSYLPIFNVRFFNWTIVILLGFEIIYIAFQAYRGQLSHFNISTPIYASLYAMMGIAASLVTVYTAYIGYLFFANEFPTLPPSYVWAIRFGIILFVVFGFEGFLMGSRLSHTIGGPDGGPGIPILNWSTKFGDPRISHFIGMHALQVLPLLSFYLFNDKRATFVLAFLYGLLSIFTLIQALNEKPLFKVKSEQNEIVD